MISCPSCGQENPDGFRLCGMCGASLAPEAAAREERKVVTVLFCDLVGFTAKAEQLDPEDVRAVLGPYHARVRTELERHGGTVEKFIGDAVMALFGAPVAHEDDPERAVRASLAIRDWAVEAGDVQVRIAVTTGEALIRLDARPEAGEGMASGDVVNTAARLQSAAPANGILADETTYRATRQTIEYGEAPSVEAKGKTEPIAVWEAVAARSRFGVDVTYYARAELVGRERELSVLRNAFERARHERIPQLVTLVAVPGMGKSRLVYELSQIVDADPELVTWRQGRCLAYGDGVAFWALAEVVKAQAGISERDTEAEAAEKLHSAIEDAFEDSGDARWVESHLRPLVGLEADTGLGGDRRGEAFAAWRRFLEALAEKRPLVLVLEDLHWADEGLLDFVDELVDWLSGVPLLVVCSARPELLERRPAWGGGKLNASTLGLPPLSEEQTALLISHVLERTLLPAEIQQALLERSEGNPLYAEQFAQLYLERGSAEDLPLPETLQGIVAARLDGLSAEEKAVLQDASVIGKVFWTGALGRDESEATPLLHSLERKGFLTRQRRSSVESEGEWAFAHMLLRDVAYGQIPRAERAHKHRETAEWIETLGRSEDHAELLAFHWTSALELSRAASQDADDLVMPTRLALRTAGDRAFAVNAYPSAAAYYGDALALWPDPDRVRPDLLFRRARALHRSGDDEAATAVEEARNALIAIDEREQAADAEALLAEHWWHRANQDAVLEHVQQARTLLIGTQPSAASGRVLEIAARYLALSGQLDDAIAPADEALRIANELELDDLRIHALTTRGMVREWQDDRSGIADVERAYEIARATNSPDASRPANNLAEHYMDHGDYRRCVELREESLQLAERFGNRDMVRFARGVLTYSRYQAGDWDGTLAFAEAVIAECEAGSPHYQESSARLNRGRIRLARGDREAAVTDLHRAADVVRQQKDPQMLVLLGIVADCLWQLGLVDESRALADETLAAAHQHAGFDVASGLAPIADELDITEEVRLLVESNPGGVWRFAALIELDRDFARAADIYAEMGVVTAEAHARLLVAERLLAEGRRAEGEAELQKALAFYRSVGATFFIQRGEQLLAKSA